MINIPLGANLQREDFFKKPREFNLERWEEKNMESLDKAAFIPFSYGKRSCIGKNMAEIVFKILISEMVNMFDMHLEKGQERTYTIQAVLTLEKCDFSLKLRE